MLELLDKSLEMFQSHKMKKRKNKKVESIQYLWETIKWPKPHILVCLRAKRKKVKAIEKLFNEIIAKTSLVLRKL
jgi:hypothetical protein